MAKKPNGFKEHFARFVEQPSRETFRAMLEEHLGETKNLDFKREWPENGKLAKHVLGMANSGGGCIVAGIEEGGDKILRAVGMPNVPDKAKLDAGLRRFLPQLLAGSLTIDDCSYTASEYPDLIGKSFQFLIVPDDASKLPWMANAETDGLRKTVIYVRRMASTEEATYEEVQEVLNRRAETGFSTRELLGLNKHFDDLEVLYDRLMAFYERFPVGSQFDKMPYFFPGVADNPHPDESFEGFVSRMIAWKKVEIERLLGFGYERRAEDVTAVEAP